MRSVFNAKIIPKGFACHGLFPWTPVVMVVTSWLSIHALIPGFSPVEFYLNFAELIKWKSTIRNLRNLVPSWHLLVQSSIGNRKMCEICSMWTIKTPEQRQWYHSGVTLNEFHIFFWCFHFWLWTSKYHLSVHFCLSVSLPSACLSVFLFSACQSVCLFVCWS